MDAIVTAGGIPAPDEALYAYTQGASKAMLELAGKPMIQWVLDALSGAQKVERVVIIGLEADSELSCSKPLTFMPNQGGMLENLLAGIHKVLEVNPAANHALVVSSDIPAITAEMVDWVVESALQTDHDIYYHVIPRQAMEARYPGSNRTFTHLKDMEVCGGDMNVINTRVVSAQSETWEKLIASRKNPLKQAGLIGYDTLLLFLLRAATLEEAVKRVCSRLHIKGRAVICPYAEVGMDVDKPHQLEMMRADLVKKAAG
jgi:GTP:adenosylcobinamide-phosphate guanylyltransferase